MALHLVGETIDKTRSHYRAETGKLIQLMRGIYVDADDDIQLSDETRQMTVEVLDLCRRRIEGMA